MTLTPEQKDHAVELIEMGDKLDAVRYLQELLDITTEQALLLTEKLEEEIEASPLLEEFKTLQDEVRKQPTVNVGRLVGTIFMSLGGVMLTVVAYLTVSHYQFSQRAVLVKGIVVENSSYESKNDNGGSTTMYTPTFQYEFEGKTYTHRSSTSSSSQDYEVNETVDVLVDPKEPKEILIDSFWEKWFLSVLLGSMGVMFAGMGYMAYRVFGKQH
ncbi:MAG: DUF3592 domain-containing protein [Bacteroidota bacterium]